MGGLSGLVTSFRERLGAKFRGSGGDIFAVARFFGESAEEEPLVPYLNKE